MKYNKIIKSFLVAIILCATNCKPMAETTSVIELTNEEQKLYNLLMDYRKEKGLPSVPISKSLTYVAQLHAKDVVNNKPDSGKCNLHSWSDKGNWTSCCYTSDHSKASCMWNKPKELTSYKGKGYEISYKSSVQITPESALNSWKNSSGHNAVIINEETWSICKWNAIGIGIYKGYACVWFGMEVDE